MTVSDNTSSCELRGRRCRPCEGDVPPLTVPEAEELLGQLYGWTLTDNRIHREFSFKNFAEALKFVNRVGAIAEDEGHHPDLFLHQYNRVNVILWTHAVGGLSENDFILAAKINGLF